MVRSRADEPSPTLPRLSGVSASRAPREKAQAHKQDTGCSDETHITEDSIMARRKSGRRGRGEGSLSERPDSRWQVRVPLGRDEKTGKRKYKYKYAPTQAEAVDLLKRTSGQALSGELRSTSTPRLAKFLDEWHTSNADTWKPATTKSYRDAIDLHLKPAFGHLRIEKLSPQIIQRWMTAQADEHGARRRIALARATLRSALSEAVRLDLVSRNAAAARFKVPKPNRRPIMPFEVEQATAFLPAARAHRLGSLYTTGLAC